MPKNVMTLSEAKEIVSEVLAAHGDEIDLRDLLAALPESKRPLVARMFSDLRRRGEIKTLLEVDPTSGSVSHRVSINKTLTPKTPSGGDA